MIISFISLLSLAESCCLARNGSLSGSQFSCPLSFTQKPGRVHGRAASETRNEKIPLILPIGHGGSCLDHCALGKNAMIPAQRARDLPAGL